MYEHYKPSHSDFLIHWTGKDIDEKYDPKWIGESSSITNENVVQQYLRRLKGILKFGLWMTRDKKSAFLRIGNKKVKRPCPARTCFTELKLSLVRSHAADYGRLGIGFKRPFVLDRMGGPMIYYQQKWPENWFFPPYVGQNGRYQPDDFFACFLKPMLKERSDVTMVYRYYDESEWRIIYCQEIEDRLRKLHKTKVIDKFRRPKDIDNSDFMEYVQQGGDITPEYLVPVNDKWLALIIYPSLATKVEAEADVEIRGLLNNIKRGKDSSTKLNYDKPAAWETYSKPAEIELDACRNF